MSSVLKELIYIFNIFSCFLWCWGFCLLLFCYAVNMLGSVHQLLRSIIIWKSLQDAFIKTLYFGSI